MINVKQYTNIRRILDELTKHPLLKDLNIEQVVSYVITFTGIFGLPGLYEDKEEKLKIIDYRAKLPCDLISVNQVKDCHTGVCMRSMTDTFLPDYKRDDAHELAFKIQGNVIFTSFKEGEILISYKAIALDEEGYPLLIDNPVYLDCLKQYIKTEEFTMLFDLGKIQGAVLKNAQQQYAWRAGQLHAEFTIPSVSEMESITRMWNTLLPRIKEFDNGFKDLGNREHYKVH